MLASAAALALDDAISLVSGCGARFERRGDGLRGATVVFGGEGQGIVDGLTLRLPRLVLGVLESVEPSFLVGAVAGGVVSRAAMTGVESYHKAIASRREERSVTCAIPEGTTGTDSTEGCVLSGW